eukprot:CAMPEP_0170621562 /NCGR_PEP_ID=MMETSP0224-20130122/28663_1 /TAXON_ID=285029 /ORGANISM="Togula jolla, Strain CCCM 725" /LENGTH=149 /DNA_ID=CAMNT_0010947821 /DNA_START=51 /DNA_END=500 /DNA_ORIENTATION=-
MFFACCTADADDMVFAAPIEILPALPFPEIQQIPVENEDPQQLEEELNRGSIEQLAEDEFVVEIEKTTEQSKMGLEVDKLWGRVLIVTVKEGLIDDYNQRAANAGLREVKAGYQILSVNGITESPKKMLQAVTQEQNLRLIIRAMQTKT